MYSLTPGYYGDDRVKVELSDVADLHNLLIYCKTNSKKVYFEDFNHIQYEITGIHPIDENVEFVSENGNKKSEPLFNVFNHLDKHDSIWIR